MAPAEHDPQHSLVGQHIDKYEILSILGRGGMGCVYEARNTSINKRVALKCIEYELANDDEAHERFRREALAAGAIESPHIVQIFDAGTTDDGTPYIVMRKPPRKRSPSSRPCWRT
jgi:serine/threonine-protein kinase